MLKIHIDYTNESLFTTDKENQTEITNKGLSDFLMKSVSTTNIRGLPVKWTMDTLKTWKVGKPKFPLLVIM